MERTWMLGRRLALLGGCIFIAQTGLAAPVLTIESESACGNDAWRCFHIEPGSVQLTGSLDNLESEWTITPTLPEDSANWRLVWVFVAWGGPATYSFMFPTPGADMMAVVDEFSLTDQEGRTFINSSYLIDPPFCQSVADKWRCSGGNGIYDRWEFGEFGLYNEHPLDPELPSLDGPITLRLRWGAVGTGVPESASMGMGNAYFSYGFAPIPEPSSGLLAMVGLLGLAYRQRRHRSES